MQTPIVATQSQQIRKLPIFTKPEFAFFPNSSLASYKKGTETIPPIKTESYPVKIVDLIVWQVYYSTLFEICQDIRGNIRQKRTAVRLHSGSSVITDR